MKTFQKRMVIIQNHKYQKIVADKITNIRNGAIFILYENSNG